MECKGPVEHLYTVGVLQGDEKETEDSEEIMSEILPNLMKYMNINIQEAQENPSRMNSKRCTPRHSANY